jgi:DNA polymerase-3 subunit delta
MKPEAFERIMEGGGVGPLYCVCGEESYLAERAVDRLLALVVDPAFRDFNQDIFYGNEVRGDEVLTAANTLPVFVQHRVVLVRRAGEMSAAALDACSSYLDNPCPSTLLLLVAQKVDGRKRFFAELKKRDLLVEYRRPYENQLPVFIRQEFHQRGKSVGADASAMLVALAGTDLRELASQIEKACIYVGERQQVTAADIREVVSAARIDSVFELPNALGSRDLQRALRVLTTILRDGESPVMLVGAIVRHFRQLWVLRQLHGKRLSAADIQKQSGVPPFFFKGMLEQALRFSEREYRGIFGALYSADLALKGMGGDTDVGSMRTLIFSITGPG